MPSESSPSPQPSEDSLHTLRELAAPHFDNLLSADQHSSSTIKGVSAAQSTSSKPTSYPKNHSYFIKNNSSLFRESLLERTKPVSSKMTHSPLFDYRELMANFLTDFPTELSGEVFPMDTTKPTRGRSMRSARAATGPPDRQRILENFQLPCRSHGLDANLQSKQSPLYSSFLM